MTNAETLRSMLEAIAVIPAKVDIHIAPIYTLGVILLADDRDEASLPIMNAIASQYGEVFVMDSVGGTASGRELAGCLVRPHDETNLKGTADALRMSYVLAIQAGADEQPDVGI